MEENDAVAYYDEQWQREDHTGWYSEHSSEQKPLDTFQIDELPSLRLTQETRKVVKFPNGHFSEVRSKNGISSRKSIAGESGGVPDDDAPVACILINPVGGTISKANAAAELLGFRVGEALTVGERSCVAISDCLAVVISIRNALVKANLFGKESFPSTVTYKTESSFVLPHVRLGPFGVSADIESRVAFDSDAKDQESSSRHFDSIDGVLQSVDVKLSSGEQIQKLTFKREEKPRRHCIFDIHSPWDVEKDVIITITETENFTPFDRKDYAFKSFLLDSIQQAIIVSDMKFNITYFNRWAWVLYGLLPDNIGKPIPLITKVNQEVAATIMKQIREGKSWTGTFLCKNKEDLYFPAQVTDCPIKDEKGNLIGIVGISMDNTPYEQAMKNLTTLRNNLEDIVQKRTAELVDANKQLEVELQQRRRLQGELELFSLIVRKTNTMVVVLDPELNIQWANESFFRSTAYSTDDVVGKALFALAIEGQTHHGGTPRSNSQQLREEYVTMVEVSGNEENAALRLQKSISSKLKRGAQIQDDLLMMRHSGTFWVSCDATPISADGSLQHVVVCMHDISHKKMVEAEMEAAARMKNEFVTLVSHELRTPLNGIMGATSVVLSQFSEAQLACKIGRTIEMEKLDFKDAMDTMSIVMSSSQLLLNLVNNVLDLQKIDAGKMDFNKSPMEVSSCIVRAVRACQHIANQKEVTIIVLYGGRLLSVHAESGDDLSNQASRVSLANRRRSFVSRGLGSREDSDGFSPSIIPDLNHPPHDQWQRVLHIPCSSLKQTKPVSLNAGSTFMHSTSGEFTDVRPTDTLLVTPRTMLRRQSMPAVHALQPETIGLKQPSRWVKRMYDDCGDVNLVAEGLDTGRYWLGDSPFGSEDEDKEFRDMPDFIVSDAAKLTQCCINLIGNAIKFSPMGSVVKLEVQSARSSREPGKQQLLFSVCDQGSGVALEEEGKLFKKFSQINPASKEAARGSGLGLSICKNLLDFLGGGIWYGDGYIGAASGASHDAQDIIGSDGVTAGISTAQTPFTVARDIATLKRLKLPVPSEAFKELESALTNPTPEPPRFFEAVEVSRISKSLNASVSSSQLPTFSSSYQPLKTSSPLRGCFRGARFHFNIPVVRPISASGDVAITPSAPSANSSRSNSRRGSTVRVVCPQPHTHSPSTITSTPETPSMIPTSTRFASLPSSARQSSSSLSHVAAAVAAAAAAYPPSIADSAGDALEWIKMQRRSMSISMAGLRAAQTGSMEFGQTSDIPTSNIIETNPLPSNTSLDPSTSASAPQQFASIPSSIPQSNLDTALSAIADKSSFTMPKTTSLEQLRSVRDLRKPADSGDLPFATRKAMATISGATPGSTESHEIHIIRKIIQTDPTVVKVLVVDDDAINKKVLSKILKDLGRKVFQIEMTCSTASNGEEALDAMHATKFDVVFMDVMMPVMDGLEAVRRACVAWPEEKDRPVILSLTANAMQADMDATMDAGADFHVTKPVTLGKIKSILCHLGLNPVEASTS